MRSSKNLVTFGVGLGVALAYGCRFKPRQEPILISRVTVSDSTLTDNGALDITPEDLKQHLVGALDVAGRFRPLPPDQEARQEARKGAPPSYRAKAELTFTRESDDLSTAGAALRRAEVALSLTLTPSRSDGDGEQLRAAASASRLFDSSAAGADGGRGGDARRDAFRAALDQALRQAASDLLLQADAAEKSETQLVADLASLDAGVRDASVRQLSDRKSPAAVPALIERLKDPDREVVMRAMGALQEIHDARAVRPLIDLTERQDPAFVAQVIYVIGDLGGPEAEAYLFTQQNGSPEPQIRVAATEASQTLLRRRAEAQGSKLGKPTVGQAARVKEEP